MKKICVFIGFTLVTIALNSDRAIVLAATTDYPFPDPMTEDVYADATVENPSSDSITGSMTQLLGLGLDSSSPEQASLTIALDSTTTTSSLTDSVNSATDNSTDSVNSAETASDSSNSLDTTVAPNSAATFNLSRESNNIDNSSSIETSFLTKTYNSTDSFNATVASNLTSSELEAVPEPITIFGTGLALGFGFLLNREHAKRMKK